MGRRGLWVAAALVLVLGVATPALPFDAHVDKKKCRWVVKKIHGKKKRVRVCTKVKPKPKPPTPKPPTNPDIPKPGYFPRPTNPLKVALDLDGAHTASATIGSAGGSLTVTGATGTRFTLTIPGKALLDDERVTMTPVESIGGFPFSAGLIGAVEIQPHGLQLLQPATLAIVPAGNVPTAGRSGFLAHEGGGDFHVYPLRSGAEITMKLMHFSTPGVGTATASELADVLSRMPVRTQAQYESLIAAEQDADKRAGLFAAYYRDIVKPLADKAVSDDSYAIVAVRELLSWARQLDLAGLSDHKYVKPLYAGVMERVAVILRNSINKSYGRCAQHDLREIVRLIIYQRQMQLLGLDEGDALGKMEKCAHFEVDFDSIVTNDLHVLGPTGAALSGVNRAEVEVSAQDVELTMHNFRITGKKPRTVVSRRLVEHTDECHVPSEGPTEHHADFEVTSLDLGDFNITEQTLPDGRIVQDISPPRVTMYVYPGVTSFDWSFAPVDDYCGAETENGYMNDFVAWQIAAARYYSDELRAPQGAHAGEVADTLDGAPDGVNYVYALKDWGTPSGALIGRKTYSFSATLEPQEDIVAESTTLSLFHRPQ